MLPETFVDIAQVADDLLATRRDTDLGQLENERTGNVRLLDRGLRAEKQAGLAELVLEGFGANAELGRGIVALARLGDAGKAKRAFAWTAILAAVGEAVGLVVGAALGGHRLHHPVALHIGEGTARGVDWDLVEIGRAEPRFLRVEVGEQAALKQGVVGEINPRDDVGGEKRNLLGLGEEIVDVAVSYHMVLG